MSLAPIPDLLCPIATVSNIKKGDDLPFSLCNVRLVGTKARRPTCLLRCRWGRPPQPGVNTIRRVGPEVGAVQIDSTSDRGLAAASMENAPRSMAAASAGSVAR